jgi:hypothetical protein
MSQSKALSQSKAQATKAKAKPKSAAKSAATTGKKGAVAETLRIIPAPKPTPALPLTNAEQVRSDQLKALAAEIERAMPTGESSVVVDPAAVQAMIAALCRIYSAHIDAGHDYPVFSQRDPVTPTDVMVTASGLLKAANLATFELGMWQSWTGR